MSRFSELINARAKELRQSDNAVSKIFDVTPSTITRWRNGRSMPRPEHFPKLAEWLGASDLELREVAGLSAPQGIDELISRVAELAQVVQAGQQELAELRAEVRQLHGGGGEPARSGRQGRR